MNTEKKLARLQRKQDKHNEVLNNCALWYLRLVSYGEHASAVLVLKDMVEFSGLYTSLAAIEALR